MLIQEMAAFLVSPFDAEETESARPFVRDAFLDTVGCIVAGRLNPATEIASRWAREGFPQGSESSVLFEAETAGARHAAFVNAVAAHAWEFDDAGFASHPSAVLVPVVLAEAERSGRSGDIVVEAYARGYQVWGALSRRAVSLHTRGWHPTSVFGAIAAAAAVAVIRGVTEPLAAHSLGIAASLSGGVVANFGTMTKPFQVGFAAERGILAVDLAQAGVTSSTAALDGGGGLLAAVGGTASEPGPLHRRGEARDIVASPPTVKKYPICLASHRVIDGLVDLLPDIDSRRVVSVEATISESSAAVLERGQNGPVGISQFSLPFAIASTIAHGRLGLSEASPELLGDASIRDLMRTVRVNTTTSQSPEEPTFALADRLVVSTDDGNRWDSGDIRYVRGVAANPLRPGELQEKVRACLRFGEPDADRVETIITSVEELTAQVARGTSE
jgi:aconitate decarboxylase